MQKTCHDISLHVADPHDKSRQQGAQTLSPDELAKISPAKEFDYLNYSSLQSMVLLTVSDGGECSENIVEAH
jgi:hypothetical protein